MERDLVKGRNLQRRKTEFMAMEERCSLFNVDVLRREQDFWDFLPIAGLIDTGLVWLFVEVIG